VWEPCLPCTEGNTTTEEVSLNRKILELPQYNPSVTYNVNDEIVFYDRTYVFGGTRIVNNTGYTEIQATSEWIDLTYTTTYLDENNVPIYETIPYQDNQERLWIGGYTTNPEFDFLDWENKSGKKIMRYSVWDLPQK
jgi:hypothetical protein